MPFKPSEADLKACDLLVKALHQIDPDIWQFWIDPIKECLSYIELPDKICDACKETVMSYFDYHMAQGMCKRCAEKFSKEQEAEG